MDSTSPTKIDMNKRRLLTKATKNDTGEDIESLLHLEALAAVGLTEKELEEKKRVEYEAKRKLGIVFTDQLEKHRAKNTDNLIKVRCNEGIITVLLTPTFNFLINPNFNT